MSFVRGVTAACCSARASESAQGQRLPRAAPVLRTSARRATLRRARGVRVEAKWVLIPIGTGDCSHLEVQVALPSTVVLGESQLVVGRELSATVNLALPVPTGARAGTGCRAAEPLGRAQSAEQPTCAAPRLTRPPARPQSPARTR